MEKPDGPTLATGVSTDSTVVAQSPTVNSWPRPTLAASSLELVSPWEAASPPPSEVLFEPPPIMEARTAITIRASRPIRAYLRHPPFFFAGGCTTLPLAS